VHWPLWLESVLNFPNYHLHQRSCLHFMLLRKEMMLIVSKDILFINVLYSPEIANFE